MAVAPHKATKYDNGKPTSVEDFLTVEQSLRISINGNAFTVTMQTPGSEIALVRRIALYGKCIYQSQRRSGDCD
jgi:formate dehydrogenase assembly factor FdhD